MRTRLRYGLAWIDLVLHIPPVQEEGHSVAIITRAMKTHSDGRNIQKMSSFEAPDNSQLSPDKCKVLDTTGVEDHAEHSPVIP